MERERTFNSKVEKTMNIAQIENNLKALIKPLSKEDFIYDLLLAYGTPKAAERMAKLSLSFR